MGGPHITEPAPVFSADDLTGATIGRYRIRRRLSGGGMGEVYQADDPTLKRSVALKRLTARLRQDPHYKHELMREAERASALNHTSVAGVYDVLEERDELFVVMEYVEGETLRNRLQKTVDLDDFYRIATQTTSGLSEAHSKGIVHRDIKPENIMLASDGAVKVLDFGVAKRLPEGADHSTITETDAGAFGSFAGTLAYMAPEVLLDGRVDARSDIFSLGVVFYEMLTGEHPFRSKSYTVTVDRILRSTPSPITATNTTVSRELGGIVEKMLSKDPNNRYETTLDLGADLEALRQGKPALYVHPPKPHWWTNVRQAATGAIAAAATLIVLYAVISWIWFGSSKRVVVLPFVIVGGELSDRGLADGLTFTLTSKLSELEPFHKKMLVVPASDVYASGVTSVAEARKLFGIDWAITGSLQRQGDGWLFAINLVDAVEITQTQSRTMGIAEGDFARQQNELIKVVARLFPSELDSEQETLLSAGLSQEPQAALYYTEAQGYMARYEDSENIGNAIELFRRALDADPDFALARAGLGEASLVMYEISKEAVWVERARAACQRAVELDSDSARPHICLGSLYDTTGQYEKAVSEFEQALEIHANSDEAYRGLAHVQERLGRQGDAEETYKRAIAESPDYWAGYSHLGAFYYRFARYEEAAGMFEKVVGLTPDNARGHSNLGGAYLMHRDIPLAIKHLEMSMALHPNYRAASNLGTLYYFDRADYQRAAAAFEQAAELNGSQYLVWGNLAAARKWAGDSAGATEAFERAVALAEDEKKINPRDASMLSDMAGYYAELGAKDEAQRLMEEALAMAPENAEVMFQAVVLYETTLGRRDIALTWLEKAVEGGYGWDMIDSTPGLDNFRADPEFLKLRRALSAGDSQ